MTRPQLQGVHIHCITSPSEYTPAEIEMAVHIMAMLNQLLNCARRYGRGVNARSVLAERFPPKA